MPYSINIKNKRIKLFEPIPERYPFVFKFELNTNAENIGLKEGRPIVLFEKNRDSESFFTYYGTIVSSVKSTNAEFNEELNTKNVFEITAEIKNKLDLNNDLDSLTYSLNKVYRFDRQAIHFKNAYNYLSKDDYDTILNHKIYISRTAFGRILNSLHKKHKINFIKYFIDNNPELFLNSKSKDYRKAWLLLVEYIRSHILVPYSYFYSSYDILSTVCSEDELDKIGFENYDSKPDLLKEQINWVNRDNDTNLNFDEKLLNSIENSINEEESNISFKENIKTPAWLIELKNEK